MRLYGDNKIAIHIAKNVVFQVDCHIVCKKLEEKVAMEKYVSSGH